MTRRVVLVAKLLLLLIGAACVLWSLPYLLFGLMGLVTTIADVGVDEHRRLVISLLALGSVLLLGGLALGLVAVRFGGRQQPDARKCSHCGYDLTGITGPCPECGNQ